MALRGSLLRPGSGGFFWGPQGLRGGWRVALFLLLLVLEYAFVIAAVFLAVRLTGYRPPAPGASLTPLLVGGSEVLLLVPVVIATAAMAWLEATDFAAYGLGGAAKISRFCAGFAVGWMILTVLMLLLFLTGHGVAVADDLGAVDLLRYGVEWFCACLLIGLTEELLFRGYLQKTLGESIGFWPAAVLISLVFGLSHGHNPRETYVGMVDVVFAGVLLCVGLYWLKSLWWSIGLHTAWDFCENFLYGTHDSGADCVGALVNFVPRGNVFLSGGLTGPEGSVFSLGVIALAGIGSWMVFSHRH